MTNKSRRTSKKIDLEEIMNLLNIVPLIASIAYNSGAIFTLELFSLVASIPNNCTNLQSTDHCQSDHCDCQFLNASIDFFLSQMASFFPKKNCLCMIVAIVGTDCALVNHSPQVFIFFFLKWLLFFSRKNNKILRLSTTHRK